MQKKTIRIYSPDGKGAFFYPLLCERYDLIIDDKNPDFYTTDVFDNNHMKYDCVKIFYTGENLTPDFNVFDYAIGFDRINFGDRYMRFPYYRLVMDAKAFYPRDKDYFKQACDKKKGFCNFIYSNSSRSSPERESIFRLVNSYKHVDSGGGMLNNVGYRIEDKIEWQRNYKFSIAFENSSKVGYATEKLYDALLADTIPIYWGDPDIALDFNPKRFINCHDYDSFDDVLNEIKRLDNDPDAYFNMIQQPWFSDTSIVVLEKDEAFKNWLFHIFDQSPCCAKRTTQYGWTAIYRKKHFKLSIYNRIKESSNYKLFFKNLRMARKKFYKIFGKL